MENKYTVLTPFDDDLSHANDLERCTKILTDRGVKNPKRVANIIEQNAYAWDIRCTNQQLTLLLLSGKVFIFDNPELQLIYAPLID